LDHEFLSDDADLMSNIRIDQLHQLILKQMLQLPFKTNVEAPLKEKKNDTSIIDLDKPTLSVCGIAKEDLWVNFGS